MIRQVISRGGIGDTIQRLFAVLGLKRAWPLHRVVYCCKHPDFARIFYDDVVDKMILADQNIILDDTYPQEMKQKGLIDRMSLYCAYARVEPCFPVPIVELPESIYQEKVVLLSPFSEWQQREWLVPYWLEVEAELRKKYKVVILHNEHTRVQPFKSEKAIGHNALNVCRIIKHALALISNDSGMAHVAGALNTKALALNGIYNGDRIYNSWPSVRCLQGKLSCGPCYDEHIAPCCSKVCANLQSIQPSEVLAEFQRLIAT